MSDIKLSNIFEIEHFMKILIDEFIEVDADGNFLINVGYGRVSTDRQAEQGYGLDIQEKEILNYAKNNGYKNLVLFIDDGYTGTNMDRPALQAIIKMITDFNEGKSNIRINTMIIPKIDRLGRTLLGTLQFIQDYIVSAKSENNKSRINKNREDINFVSVAENYCRIERNNPQGKFLLMLFASLAEFDRDLIVEKLQKGRISRVASGKWMGGGITPYGYIYDRDSGLLKIVPEEAEKIKEAYRLFIEEKLSPQKIADRLGFKGDTIVIQILKRKSLTGCIVYKGVEYPGQHEPIISLERWEEAQEEFESRSVVRKESNYLLTGLLVCGSPFAGKEHWHSPVCVPLAGVCLLSQGTENRMERLSPHEAFRRLAGHLYYPRQDRRAIGGYMTALRALAKLPCFALACNISTEAARLSIRTMAGRLPEQETI